MPAADAVGAKRKRAEVEAPGEAAATVQLPLEEFEDSADEESEEDESAEDDSDGVPPALPQVPSAA